MKNYSAKAIDLLKQMIVLPSFSGEETNVCELISNFLSAENIFFERKGNNILAGQRTGKGKTVLLNSHIDTVRPGNSWTKDPFLPVIEDGKLFGLGSNDAGAPLVSLLAAFLFFQQEELPFDLLFLASAEEENSGKNGISSMISDLGEIDLVIVGEPTQMQMAIAEKGLLVIDCVAHGKTGHAARDEGENALYKAMFDIFKLKEHSFSKNSSLLGKVKMSTTMIAAGTQHNVVPDNCSFTVDVRYNESYQPEEIIAELQNIISSELHPRSLRSRSSGIDPDHLIISAGEKAGITTFGSATLSDMALLPFPSIKIGPGDSARSHTPDEFIYLREIEEGIHMYVQLLYNYAFQLNQRRSVIHDQYISTHS